MHVDRFENCDQSFAVWKTSSMLTISLTRDAGASSARSGVSFSGVRDFETMSRGAVVIRVSEVGIDSTVLFD